MEDRFSSAHMYVQCFIVTGMPVRDGIFSFSQPNVERGRNHPREVAGFQNSKSGALSQWDFSFNLCAAPKFQVLVSRIYLVIWNLSEGNEGLMHQHGNTESVQANSESLEMIG